MEIIAADEVEYYDNQLAVSDGSQVVEAHKEELPVTGANAPGANDDDEGGCRSVPGVTLVGLMLFVLLMLTGMWALRRKGVGEG